MSSRLELKRNRASATSQARRGKGRPPSSPDESKRQMIADVTSRLFIEHGYQGVTMAQVAAAAHVSLSTIYRLFPGKPQLFSAIVEWHRHSMMALPGDYDALPIETALEKIFWVDLDSASERRRGELVRRIVAESRKIPELQPMFHDQGPEYSRRLLTEWLERQQVSGRIRVVDAAILAGMLMDIAFGMSSPKFSGDPDWDGSSERTNYLRTCFAMIVGGLKPENAKAATGNPDQSNPAVPTPNTDERKENP
jgi:AcrR family transcriptional regulator